MRVENDSIMVICSCKRKGKDDGKIPCFIHHECKDDCTHEEGVAYQIELEYEEVDNVR